MQNNSFQIYKFQDKIHTIHDVQGSHSTLMPSRLVVLDCWSMEVFDKTRPEVIAGPKSDQS